MCDKDRAASEFNSSAELNDSNCLSFFAHRRRCCRSAAAAAAATCCCRRRKEAHASCNRASNAHKVGNKCIAANE